MSRNVFDQAARFAAKFDAAEFVAWALGLPDASAYGGWLDARGVPFPGDLEGINDSVARLTDSAAGGLPWAVPIEFRIEPDPLMFGRLLAYLGNLWLSAKPDPERGSRFEVGAVVVNLTGAGRTSRRMHWPAAGLTTHLHVAERNLASESADDLVTDIESGRRSRGLLPWVPLMTGGGEPGIIDRWKAAALGEPESHRRSEMGGLAEVFASAAGRERVWEKALEGWNVRESSVVSRWRAEARAEGYFDVIVAELEGRFGTLPQDLFAALRKRSAADLQQWVPIAFRCSDLADFRTRAGLN